MLKKFKSLTSRQKQKVVLAGISIACFTAAFLIDKFC